MRLWIELTKSATTHGKATMTWFEVVDETDEVSYIYLRQGDVDGLKRFSTTLTWFEEIFEEY
ncbi:hypothetical protein [Streptococcus pneumoniae]|uniref:hypothetical protein n=1 Tax=Streptococcus pneumoniae TaxID=1313 RepID=UPI00115650EC|nr:hypothetical protein [Streptococcus pneumoniae]